MFVHYNKLSDLQEWKCTWELRSNAFPYIFLLLPFNPHGVIAQTEFHAVFWLEFYPRTSCFPLNTIDYLPTLKQTTLKHIHVDTDIHSYTEM